MNNEIKSLILTNLEGDMAALANTIAVITSQGYIVNQIKYSNLMAMSLVINMFNHYDSLDKERQKQLEVLFNSL